MRYIILILSFFYTSLLSAQCYPDRHNTTWYDSWISCEAAANPNTERGEGHWLHYDLGHFYILKNSKFWNANRPDFLEDGLQEIVIDYSMDGITWQEWGTHTIEMASGSKYYEGEEGPDFGNIAARYVLITAINNYGGSCYSLGELKIDVEEFTVSTEDILDNQVTIFPNPARHELNVRFTNALDTAPMISITDVLGRMVQDGQLDTSGTLDISSLSNGVYFLEIEIKDERHVIRFIKKG